MKTLIFFDTNFIFSNKSKFDFIDRLREEEVEIYSSNLVRNELKGKYRRVIKAKYKKLSSVISDAKDFIDLDFIKGVLDDETTLIDSYKKSDDDIDAFFEDMFKGKLIPLLEKHEMIDTLFKRNMMKTPPFNEGESDKGFMDTLIWVSFLEYCKINNFDRYIFITNDGDFNKQNNILTHEFKSLITNGDFEIKKFNDGIEVLKHLGIIKKGDEAKNTYIDTPKDYKIIDTSEVSKEFISEIQEVVENIMTSEPDFYGYQSYNFKFDKRFQISDVESFCDEMLKEKHNFLFFKYVDLTGIFSAIGFNCIVKGKIDIDSYNKFIDMWQIINNDKEELKIPFLTLVKESLNEMVKLKQDVNIDNSLIDDLPF